MTTLEGKENNYPLLGMIENGNIPHNKLVNSIYFRIERHQHYIKQHAQVILDNIEHSNIVLAETQKIIERQAKIHELREFHSYLILAFA